MKNILLISIGFLLLNYTSVAQVDLEEKEEYKLFSDYEVATGQNLDTKTLFKATANGFDFGILDIGVEQKIGKSFSLNLAARIGILNTISGQLDLRYYPKQKSLIKKGYGNNLNGLYFNAGFGAKIYDFDFDNSGPSNYTAFGLGIQSRFLKHGLVDFNLSLVNVGRDIYLSPTIGAGFAISKFYGKNEFQNSRCHILKCFEERKYQIKIPLNRLIDLAYRPDSFLSGFWIYARLGFEHRLAKGLSMNHSIFYGKGWSTRRFEETARSVNQKPEIQLSNNLRWYFLKARSIAKGKSADNLSGPYVESDLALTFFHRYSFDFSNEPFENSTKFRRFDVGLNAGFQTRLFKRFYLDAQISRNYSRIENKGVSSGNGVNYNFIDSVFFNWAGLVEVGLLF